MTSTSGNDGTSQRHGDLRRRPQPRHRGRRRAEPHLAGRRAAAERGEAGRHLGDEGRRTTSCSPPACTPRTAQYDPLFISNYIDRFVKDELQARARASATCIIFGERKYAMRLWLDPDRLAGRSITADEVVSALREQNVQVAAGQVGAAAGARGADLSDQRPRRRPADRAVASSTTSSSSASPDGTLVRLKDVGRTELGAENYATDLALQRPRRRRLRRAAAADGQRARRCYRDVSARARAAVEALPARA